MVSPGNPASAALGFQCREQGQQCASFLPPLLGERHSELLVPEPGRSPAHPTGGQGSRPTGVTLLPSAPAGGGGLWRGLQHHCPQGTLGSTNRSHTNSYSCSKAPLATAIVESEHRRFCWPPSLPTLPWPLPGAHGAALPPRPKAPPLWAWEGPWGWGSEGLLRGQQCPLQSGGGHRASVPAPPQPAARVTPSPRCGQQAG